MRRRLWTSGLIWLGLGVILALGGVTAGKWLLLTVALVAQMEAGTLIERIGQRQKIPWRANFFLLISTALILGGFLFAEAPQYPLAAGLLLILLTQLSATRPQNLVVTLLSVVIICLGFGALAGIERLPIPNSLWIVVWVIACVKLADANAYLCGRYLGRNRINTAISPLKSYEGLYGGLIAGGVMGFVGAPLFIPTDAGFWLGPVLGMILALVGSLGDFVESALKRAAGVKDSGTLLPGIGGILDLTDSLLLAAPLAWVVLRITMPI
jgi:phosphatidate cytidylyltransferase